MTMIMVWTDQHDTMLCRETLTLNPFQYKKSSVQRGQIWHEIAMNLISIKDIFFKVDRRAVRDRYNLLSGKLRKKLKEEQRATGIQTEMTETEVALEDLIEREDEAEAQHKENAQAGRKKKADEREGAEDMRAKALERLGETQKRKAGGNETNIKKRRSSGKEAVHYLKEKNEMLAAARKEEMALKVKSEEAERQRHQDFMKVMQQQHQEQMQGIHGLMLQQQQQQNQLIMAMLSKVVPK